MKGRFLSLFGLVFMFGNMVFADGPIVLQATSGQKVLIWYAPPVYYADGNTASRSVNGIHITVEGGIPGETRVVLINKCVPSNAYGYPASETVFDCAYNNDGTWVNSATCAINNKPLDSDYESSRVVVWAANHGGEKNCYQQIAVAPKLHSWLEDPVTGQHNFNFRFPLKKE